MSRINLFHELINFLEKKMEIFGNQENYRQLRDVRVTQRCHPPVDEHVSEIQFQLPAAPVSSPG